MLLSRSYLAALGSLMACAVATPALADMGQAPAGPGVPYASIEGGYLYQNGSDVRGYGITVAPGAFEDVLVSPTDGWFAGGLISFGNGGIIIQGLPFTRVEVYGLFGRLEDNASDTSPPLASISLKNDDGTTNVAGADSGRTGIVRQITEGGFRLEGDQSTGSASTITWALSPFVRFAEEDARSEIFGCCIIGRSSSVDTLMYGVLVAMEPEFEVATGVALVGRAGIGVYGFNADGSFHSSSTLPGPDPFAAQVSDSEAGVGFRGQIGAELKFKIAPGANLETFAEADYFSDVGTADLADADPASAAPSQVASSDLWEVRGGVRLTFAFGGGQ